MEYIGRHFLVFLCYMQAVLPIWCETLISQTGCFDYHYNMFTRIKISCDAGKVIHFLEIVGSAYKNESCAETRAEPLCQQVVRPTQSQVFVWSPCNGWGHCRQLVGKHVFTNCSVTSARIKYDCVVKSAVYDMCSDEAPAENASTPVVYMKSPGFPHSSAHGHECRCTVTTQAGSLTVNLLHLGFDFLEGETRLVVKNATSTLWDSNTERLWCNSSACLLASFLQQNHLVTQSQSRIQIAYDNRNTSGQNVWMEIIGHPNELLTVRCNGAHASEDNTTIVTSVENVTAENVNVETTVVSAPTNFTLNKTIILDLILHENLSLLLNESFLLEANGTKSSNEVILLYAIAFIGLVGITGLVVAINIYNWRRRQHNYPEYSQPFSTFLYSLFYRRKPDDKIKFLHLEMDVQE